MKRRLQAAALSSTLCIVISYAVMAAGPVDEKLVIDGEVELTSRAPAPEGHPLKEVISGWHYRTDETRALEMDSFENPGMLAVVQGGDIWNTVEGSEAKSCASCHDDAAVSMKNVGATYPKWDEAAGKPINIEQRINQPLQMSLVEGDMRQWWERGEDLYYTRTGQLDLSCASCHEQNNGKYIRADHLSQGNVNGLRSTGLSVETPAVRQ